MYPGQNPGWECIVSTLGNSECSKTGGVDSRFCCCGSNCPVPNGTGDEPNLTCTALETSADSDWVRGPQSFSCDEACACVGKTCNAGNTATLNSQDAFDAVLGFLNGAAVCNNGFGGTISPQAPTQNVDNGRCFFNTGSSTGCSRKSATDRRYCCCGDICPT